MKGIVMLYNQADEMIGRMCYHHRSRRDEIVNSWKKTMGPAFNNCAIHILPEIEFHNIREDGTNFRRGKPSSWLLRVVPIGL